MTKFDFKQWIIDNKAKNKRALNEQLNEQAPMVICGSVPGNVCHQYKECINNTLGPTQVIADSGGANPSDFYNSLGNPAQGATVLDNNGRKWKYINDQGGSLNITPYGGWPYASSATPACCGPQGCPNPASANGSAANVCGCDGISGPSSTGCCQGVGYTECINCCCNAHMQMENVMEDTNPTIDAVSKLITLAEQRRRTDDAEREPSRRERPTISRPEDQPKGKGGKIRPSDDIKFSAAAPVSGGDPAVAPGACSANHYTSTQPWTLIDTTAPDINTLDPATGLCECDPTAYPTVATIHNPSPQTVDANNYPQGQSAPCP